MVSAAAMQIKLSVTVVHRKLTCPLKNRITEINAGINTNASRNG
ncbi:MAG: hypothetical protein HW420_470 [Candidatus Nitrosotenuis sp.]|nr:hypothetical protein [Candidatus Nitrosotenuis sp.]